MKSLYPKTIMFLIILLGTISCKDDLNIKSEKNELVRVTNGFLEFRDKAAYDQLTQQLNGKSSEELDTWEKSLTGFISMRSIYSKALAEEETFFKNGGSDTDHSAFVKQNPESFVYSDEKDLLPNLPYYTDILPTFVNKLGMVKIGVSIFEYRSGTIKEIRDGVVSKINQLKNITESNKEANISVINIFAKDVTKENGKTLKIAFSGNSSCTGYTSGGGQRVQGNITIYNYTMVDVWGQTPYPGQVVYLTEVTTMATNQNKTLGHWGNKNTSQLQIIGTVTVSPYGTVSVNANSGGAQTPSIAATLYSSGWVNTGWNPVLSISGALTFYGRDGSNCTI